MKGVIDMMQNFPFLSDYHTSTTTTVTKVSLTYSKENVWPFDMQFYLIEQP
jgi:hypothetical protein